MSETKWNWKMNLGKYTELNNRPNYSITLATAKRNEEEHNHRIHEKTRIKQTEEEKPDSIADTLKHTTQQKYGANTKIR